MTSQTATPARRGRRVRPPARRPGRLARVAADARVAWAVAMVLAASLAVVSVLYAPLAVAERDRERVAQVAGETAARLTTFSSGDLEAWAEGFADLVTPRYAEEVAGLLDEQVRARLGTAGTTSRGEVTDVYVQDLDRGSATVFAVARQSTLDEETGGSVEFGVRMTMTLRRTAEGWRVDEVAVLGTPSQEPPPGR